MKQHEELHKNVSISVNRLQAAGGGDGGDESTFATISNNSIIEFLNDEQKCLSSAVDNNNESEVDIESIFEEIKRLSDTSDERSVDEILREAELLLSKQQQIESNLNGNDNGFGDDGAKSIDANRNDEFFKKWQFDEHLKTISEESTPRNMKSHSSDSHGDDDVMQQQPNGVLEREHNKNQNSSVRKAVTPVKSRKTKPKLVDASPTLVPPTSISNSNHSNAKDESQGQFNASAHDSLPNIDKELQNSIKSSEVDDKPIIPVEEIPSTINDPAFSLPILSKSRSSRSPSIAMLVSPTTPASCMSVSCMSASTSFSWTRERALEQQIDGLKETLKDTEERLNSLRLQYDNISQMHRKLRETNHHMQEEMDRLKIDAQHLHECANILRTELQAARKDRAEALEMQALLQRELDASRNEKRKACEEAESNSRQILDLQRQCKEMERILARKNPDTMKALIGIGTRKANDDQAGRRALEQRIAQLESDAKEQDRKAQLILANVQSRFSSVQSKYETHISDLETQVLSLQQINQILNEKLEAQSKLRTPNNNYLLDQESCATQTEPSYDRMECITASVCTQTEEKSPINSATTKANAAAAKKTPKQNAQSAKEETHLLATIRGMRVDLAIKEKALQRLTRELDECKKTMKKLQKDNEAGRAVDKTNRKQYDPAAFTEPSDAIQLQDALQKIKLLEGDYKALHDKRLQDLKTLQNAHEREVAANQETVRLLEQRLAERDEAFAIIQKHNKVPIDYFALKAKVSSLERRHTEREQRLHILVEALSKGRLSGSFDQCLSESA